jgi:predicted Zn-ribbon and HTH transcriptional regulator
MAKTMACIMRREFDNRRVGSLFYFEGVFIAELRSSLCLTGWAWPMADQAARNVVAEALRLARAERPGWAEGQHAATGLLVKDAVCRHCGVGLRARQVHFCSRKCHWHWWKAFNAEAA